MFSSHGLDFRWCNQVAINLIYLYEKISDLRSLSIKLHRKALPILLLIVFLFCPLKNCHFTHWYKIYFLLLVHIHVKYISHFLLFIGPVIFKAQPMCSWGYDFSPRKVKESYHELSKVIFGHHVTIKGIKYHGIKGLCSSTLTGLHTWLRKSLPRGFYGNVFATQRRKPFIWYNTRRETQQLNFD